MPKFEFKGCCAMQCACLRASARERERERERESEREGAREREREREGGREGNKNSCNLARLTIGHGVFATASKAHQDAAACFRYYHHRNSPWLSLPWLRFLQELLRRPRTYG